MHCQQFCPGLCCDHAIILELQGRLGTDSSSDNQDFPSLPGFPIALVVFFRVVDSAGAFGCLSINAVLECSKWRKELEKEAMLSGVG